MCTTLLLLSKTGKYILHKCSNMYMNSINNSKIISFLHILNYGFKKKAHIHAHIPGHEGFYSSIHIMLMIEIHDRFQIAGFEIKFLQLHIQRTSYLSQTRFIAFLQNWSSYDISFVSPFFPWKFLKMQVWLNHHPNLHLNHHHHRHHHLQPRKKCNNLLVMKW